MFRVLLTVFALAIVAGCAPSVSPTERARALEQTVWSPYCPGRLLNDCPTAQAAELRNEILARVRSGDTDADVRQWIVMNYGAEAIADGTNPWAWGIPLAAVALGMGAVAVMFRRWTSRPPEPAS